MSKGPFSGPALILLLSCAVALFAASALLEGYGEGSAAGGKKAGPGAYSVSALGYAGFYDTLRRLERPVVRSAGRARAMAGQRGLLIVAEPDIFALPHEYIASLADMPRLLLVLPKRHGERDSARPEWIARAIPVPVDYAQQTLALVAGDGSIARGDWPVAWKINELGVTPSGSGWVQLARSKGMRPVVGNDDGMLVGELRHGDDIVWVLSDPDLMANHGLGKGDNAAFMVALVDRLGSLDNSGGNGPIVFDETAHGFQEAESSPVALLFRFPFVIVTALLCVSALLFARAGASRFGAPRTPPPETDFGKSRLIGNGARLLDYAGHHALVLERYARMTVRSAAVALRAPSGLSEDELARWLDRVGKARGVKDSCADILHTVDTIIAGDAKNLSGLFACARNIHRWKGELLHGASAHRRAR